VIMSDDIPFVEIPFCFLLIRTCCARCVGTHIAAVVSEYIAYTHLQFEIRFIDYESTLERLET